MIRITNEEKNHIKLMHGLINEQSRPVPASGSKPPPPSTKPSPTSTKPSPTSTKPSPTSTKPSPPKPNNDLINKTINLYTDIENKNYKNKYTINSIKPNGDLLEITLKDESNILVVTWNCLNSDKLSVKNSNEVLYNIKFLEALKTEYCSKSSSGTTVPKADFASNTRDNTNNDLA